MTATLPAATGLTEEQLADLETARQLARDGVPVFCAPPDGSKLGFALPLGWQRITADPSRVDSWQPGWALCAVTGHGLDLVDADPRNGATALPDYMRPTSYGAASTPSGGAHVFVRSLDIGSRDNFQPGYDYKGGRPDGEGRGFAWIAPTVRHSKVTGEPVAYRWTQPPNAAAARTAYSDHTGGGLRTTIEALRGASAVPTAGGGPKSKGADVAFDEWEALRGELTELVRTSSAGGRWDRSALLRHAAHAVRLAGAEDGTALWDGCFAAAGVEQDDSDRGHIASAAAKYGAVADVIVPAYVPPDLDSLVPPAAPDFSERTTVTGDRAAGVPIELDAFLSSDDPEYDWLIPGLLERRDRLLVTGPEGGGKSTLLRQMAVQLASGIHPFGGEPYEPVRVLLLDVENSERQIRRAIRPLRKLAGHAYAQNLGLMVKPEGIALATSGEDREWFCEMIREFKPDIVIGGPLYKLSGGDPIVEEDARLVASLIDKLRTEVDCAFITEAHSPHASGGSQRPKRPYGASLWIRWPEFGLHLNGGLDGDGALTHWRGARDERQWPSALQRGGDWPWEPAAAGEQLWTRIVLHVQQHGSLPPQRALAEAVGSNQAAVSRVLKTHQAERDMLGW